MLVTCVDHTCNVCVCVCIARLSLTVSSQMEGGPTSTIQCSPPVRLAIECDILVTLLLWEHLLRARPSKKRLQAMSWVEHPRAQTPTSRCKKCTGSSICEHNREGSTCKQCGGSSICEHNHQRIRCCKQCGGSSICEHNRERSKFKQCDGSST